MKATKVSAWISTGSRRQTAEAINNDTSDAFSSSTHQASPLGVYPLARIRLAQLYVFCQAPFLRRSDDGGIGPRGVLYTCLLIAHFCANTRQRRRAGDGRARKRGQPQGLESTIQSPDQGQIVRPLVLRQREEYVGGGRHEQGDCAQLEKKSVKLRNGQS